MGTINTAIEAWQSLHVPGLRAVARPGDASWAGVGWRSIHDSRFAFGTSGGIVGIMNRRTFLAATTVTGTLTATKRLDGSADAATPATTPEVTREFTAGSGPGPVFGGSPVVSGPAPDATTILQPLQRHATGHLEYAVGEGAFQRVDAVCAGMRPLAAHVLKFRLPPLPPGALVRYRIKAHTVGWVRVREFQHGEIVAGDPQTTAEHEFRTLDPSAESTTFAVWNDTHENAATLRALHQRTSELRPDFLLWNGDQSNDAHFEREMAGQFLAPHGLAVADRWPLAYVRGNHDVRGPAASSLPDFTGTPGDRYYYAFRSGPLAALIMDTGEDKPDDSDCYGGMAAFEAMQREQAEWIKAVIREPWFQEAPFKILFCHIPLWFTRDIFPQHRRYEFHPFCRGLWLPSLVEAGVRLVVSGHTHDHRWMPARDSQPLGQLIGGGPQPRHATFIRGTATRQSLELVMSRLDGTVLQEVKFSA